MDIKVLNYKILTKKNVIFLTYKNTKSKNWLIVNTRLAVIERLI